MIYDRTKEDVANAKTIVENYVKKFLPLTDEQRETLERGMLTTIALTRIFGKQHFLKNKLNGLGYYGTPITVKTFTKNEVFDVDIFKDMIQNNIVLYEAFLPKSDTPNPNNLSTTFDIETFNAIEKMLVDIESVAGDVETNWRECGTFVCGEV